MAVQVGPIKPTFKAPGTKRLKLKYAVPLSNFAFKFNIRRYTKMSNPHYPPEIQAETTLINFTAGAYTRPLLSST
jgi:hypothetical protein